jgi:hypothetical protein
MDHRSLESPLILTDPDFLRTLRVGAEPEAKALQLVLDAI